MVCLLKPLINSIYNYLIHILLFLSKVTSIIIILYLRQLRKTCIQDLTESWKFSKGEVYQNPNFQGGRLGLLDVLESHKAGMVSLSPWALEVPAFLACC